MKNHIQSQCLKYPHRENQKNQSTLAFKPKEEGESSSKLVSWVFNFDECKKALAEMIILDELSFRFVEGFGFRKFMSVAQPRFNPIPCRTTIAKTCFRVFLDEKQKLKEALREQRVCLTTDTWTSVQNLNYMCLTAHFIDSDWKIHKRILSFCLVENHKGETLGKAVEMCLLDWGIDKILTITVDNAASNSGLISFIQKKTKHRKATVLGHKYLHVRCSAHILNLIVREGLVEMDETIVKVRKSVKYVRSSPQRQNTFKLCAEKEKVEVQNQLCLDVPTRWNYTYIMLEKAEKYQKAFERLEEDDPNFLRTIREESKEEGNDRHEVAWGMDDVDWEKIRIFSKFLKIFYDATLRFSGASYVTSNSFFLELMSIHDTIELEHEKDSYLLRTMSDYMKNKFEKYWGNFDNMNHLLYVGLVLDPRYKLRYLEYCFGTLYERQKAVDMVGKVKAVLEDLYKFYSQNQVGSSGASAAAQAQGQNPSGLMEGDDYNVVDAKAIRMMGFRKHLKGIDSSNIKSEVDKYLLESCEDFDDNFDILAWWKVNSPRYRVLSRVARHVLAISVSTVASESAFSTAGRVLDPFRSSLSPLMVEALICGQNWLRPSSTPICLRAAMDDVEEFEKLDGELVSDAALTSELGMSTPTSIEVDG